MAHPHSDPHWDPKTALQSLETDAVVNEEDEMKATRRLFKESAPGAAMSIIHLSMYAEHDRVRLDASKYVVERVLGPTGSDTSDADNPLENLLADVIDKAEAYANGEQI